MEQLNLSIIEAIIIRKIEESRISLRILIIALITSFIVLYNCISGLKDEIREISSYGPQNSYKNMEKKN